MHGDSERYGDQRQHAAVRGGQPGLARSHSDIQRCDDLPAVRKLQRYDGPRRAVDRDHLAVDGQRGVRETERGADRGDNAGEPRGQLLADPRRDARRVMPVAVQRSIDELLQSGKNRRNDQRDEDRDCRGPTDLGRDQRVEQRHQHRVDTNSNQRQQTPRQRTGDNQPDVE